jgi:hypothetical protein
VDLPHIIRASDVRAGLGRSAVLPGFCRDCPGHPRQTVWIELDVKVEVITWVQRNVDVVRADLLPFGYAHDLRNGVPLAGAQGIGQRQTVHEPAGRKLLYRAGTRTVLDLHLQAKLRSPLLGMTWYSHVEIDFGQAGDIGDNGPFLSRLFLRQIQPQESRQPFGVPRSGLRRLIGFTGEDRTEQLQRMVAASANGPDIGSPLGGGVVLAFAERGQAGGSTVESQGHMGRLAKPKPRTVGQFGRGVTQPGLESLACLIMSRRHLDGTDLTQATAHPVAYMRMTEAESLAQEAKLRVEIFRCGH